MQTFMLVPFRAAIVGYVGMIAAKDQMNLFQLRLSDAVGGGL